jgi:ketosteroid isomerase-like protein
MHATITRLRDAVNAHDPDAMVALFAPDYRSEQPAHPNRGFGGSDQVHKNWSTMFAGVPDLAVEVRAHADDGSTSWSEWDWRGQHADGTPFHERGVIVMGLRDDGAIVWARLYMEPVETGGADIDETVRQIAKMSE